MPSSLPLCREPDEERAQREDLESCPADSAVETSMETSFSPVSTVVEVVEVVADRKLNPTDRHRARTVDLERSEARCRSSVGAEWPRIVAEFGERRVGNYRNSSPVEV